MHFQKCTSVFVMKSLMGRNTLAYVYAVLYLLRSWAAQKCNGIEQGLS